MGTKQTSFFKETCDKFPTWSVDSNSATQDDQFDLWLQVIIFLEYQRHQDLPDFVGKKQEYCYPVTEKEE